MKNETLFDVSESFNRQLKQQRKDLGIETENSPKLKQGLTLGLGIATLVGAGFYLLKRPHKSEGLKDQLTRAS